MARRLLLLGLCVLVLCAGCFKPSKSPQSTTGNGGKKGTFPNETITAANKERAYRLVVPTTLDLSQPVPVVFAFHGLGDSKDLMPLYSQLDQLAVEKGFILVYPNANGKAWPLVVEWAREDLAFFDALYDHLAASYKIDRNRVYLTGMSNGAYFTHVLGSQRAEKIAAIAVHSGGPGPLGFSEQNLAHKYPVFVIHGAQDSVVEVKEGQRTRDMYRRWGHPVQYLELRGHNHFWATNEGINEQIWAFFAANPRQ